MTTTLTLLSEGEFRSGQYADLAENISGNLSDVIAKAEAHIVKYLDRQIAKATYVETYVQRQAYIFTRQYPIVAVTQVRRRGDPRDTWTVLDAADFWVVNDELPIVQYFGPSTLYGAQVEITYDAGYDPVPADIKHAAMLQTVLYLYQDYEVYGVGDGKAPGIRYMQDDIHGLIDPHKRLQRAL